MSRYIKTLNDDMEAAQRHQVEQTSLKHSDEAAAARERMTPLADRLRHLLATIPAEVQHEGLSLPALSTMLRGRRGRSCSAGELGTALRGLGWKRTRCWRGGDDGSFSARWYPPGSI